MRHWQQLIGLCLLLCSGAVQAVVCSDIWTQAVRANSSVPATITLPAALNATFPEDLSPIDYYYSGNFVSGANRIARSSSATARLIIDGNLTVESGSRFNASGLAQNFMLVVTGSLTIQSDVVINGFILAGGAISITNGATVNGAVTARGAIANNGTVNYQSAQLININGGTVCQNAFLELKAHYPLDQCSGPSSGIIEDLTGSYPASAVNIGAQPDGQVLQAASFSAAPDYVNVPAALVNGAGNFSLALWFRLDSSGSGFRELFSASSNSSDTELEFYINGSNELRAGLKGTYHNFSGGSTSAVVATNVWTQATLVRNGSQLCVYLNNNLVNCVSASSSNLSVVRAAIGIWWRANASLADDFHGDIDEVLWFNQALSAEEVALLYQNQQAGNSFDGTSRADSCSVCLADDFNAAVLADSWVAARSSGSFTPAIINGRLRMTQAVSNQSTSVTFQRLYPAANNLVVVEFDYRAYGGSGADGMALVLSDATVTPQPGAFGGPLGYGFKPGIPGFAGGWLGFGLDEFGNFSNEGGSANVGRRRQSVVIRGSGSGTSGYRYLRGTCNNGTTNTGTACLSPAVDGNENSPHRYRFTIDSRVAGTTQVSVERNTGSGFVSLIAPFNAQSQTGQEAVPENFFLSFTGSTGGSTNIHELDNLSICALRSTPIGPLIDHIELTHPATNVSCLAAPVQLKACLNADCSSLFTDPVSVTLSNTAGNWATQPVAITNGTGTAYLRNVGGGISTIGVTETVPARKAFSQTRCKVGASSSNCQINFVNAGLAFTATDGSSAVPNQIAGQAGNALLRAVRTSATTGACEARVSGAQTVQLGFSCENPGSCIAGQQFSVNSSVLGANSAGVSSNANPVTLNFDASGSAPLSLNYTDVGQLRLHASLTLPEQPPEPALTLSGSSNSFVVKPHTLAVISASRLDGSLNPATTNTGDGFVAAGELFNASVEARNASGTATPNFGRETPRQQVNLAFDSLLYPAGGVNGVLNSGNTDLTLAASGGRQQVVNLSWQEVGSIRLNARLSNSNYLGAGDVITTPASGVIGRFYPQHFVLTNSSTANSCGSYSYMSEPAISLSYQLEARNVANNVTQNYGSGYSDTAQFAVVAENLSAGSQTVDLGSRLALNSSSWLAGVYTVSQTNAAFNRLLSGAADGPFAQLQLGLQRLSERDMRNLDGLNMDASTAGSAECGSSCPAVTLASPLDLRYGRLMLENSYGPESEDLPLQLVAQYWNGNAFVLNSADQCSPLASNRLLDATTGSVPLIMTKELPYSGDATQNIATLPVTTLLQNGQAKANNAPLLWLQAPQQRGQGRVQYQLDDHPWLQYDWDGNSNYSDNPAADFVFGRFRGNPRQISWRELFN
uniref:MSHA biogenesis protein MshQ n=1 Tax=Rheinheimera sp. BAL341 TaxID=1708203 RepID=A0A486XH89_9GAMM